MRAFLVSLILCCVGVHSSYAIEQLVKKKVGKWFVFVGEDEFTKNKIAGIGVGEDKSGLIESPSFAINAGQNDLTASGKVVPAPLFTFSGSYPGGDKIGDKATILGILVDGVSMALKGETWKKDLIAAMLKGEKFVIRFQGSSPKGPRIATISTSLDGFAECWAAIPKDLINLKNPSGINDTKKPLPDTAKHPTTINVKWLFGRSRAQEWTEGVLLEYDAATGFGIIMRSGLYGAGTDDRHTEFGREWSGSLLCFSNGGRNFSDTNRLYLKVIASRKERGVPIKADAPQLARLFVEVKTWVGKNGKEIQGVLLSYDSAIGEAIVLVAENSYLRIKKESLSQADQLYLDVVARYTANGMPLKCQGYPRTQKIVSQSGSTLGGRKGGVRSVAEETKWITQSLGDLYVPAINRTWSSAGGTNKFEGVLVALNAGGHRAEIRRKADGRIFTIEANKLSREDSQYLGAVSSHMSEGAALVVIEKQK